MNRYGASSELSTPGTMPKSERALREAFLAQLETIPGGEKIKACIQCGTCTGSCPVSYVMDISPREVIALFRAGDIQSILRSRTIWVCSSCYACTTRCPSGIKITDILYALKRIAMDRGIFPSRFPVYAVSEGFAKMVNRYGRNYELGLVAYFLLRGSVTQILAILPLGWRLFRKKRIAFLPKRIKGLDQIKKIIARADAMSIPVERERFEFAARVGYGATTEMKKGAGPTPQGGAR